MTMAQRRGMDLRKKCRVYFRLGNGVQYHDHRRYIRRAGAAAVWPEALIVTLAAQITPTPIILHVFGRLSLVTLLTNFLILPVRSYVMIFGGFAILLGLAVQPLGWAVGWIAWAFLTYTMGSSRITTVP